MCGICGFSWSDSALIERMNKAIAHRGPDDQGKYVDDKVSLGHRRLSIIDLSPAGIQPMSNEDGSVWIVFNGEVYNFNEIRRDLETRGHKFRSNTDTEVVIHAYEEWGHGCIEQFNGMWGFAIYDKRKDILFLCRDRFGVKPLYYYYDENYFIFSSEIKGILQHEIIREPNDRILYEYLAFELVDHSRQTFFKGIQSLMPGESMVYSLSNKSLEFRRWYSLEHKKKDIFGFSEEDLLEKVRALFVDSVRYRLISDVPVGSCLSGGIDSSSIVCVMRKLAKGNKIKTFSLVFPGLPIDESQYIEEVVRETQVESYKTTPTVESLAADLYDLVRIQEEPFGSLSIYGQYKVMQLAHQKGMKVLLDGQGGDELFAGYSKYKGYYLFECLRSLRLGEFLRNANPSFASFLAVALMGRTALTRRILGYIKKKRALFLRDFYTGETDYGLFKRGFDLNASLQKEIAKYSIPHLLRYEDRNSMRWSIESRVPFLDYRLAELASSLNFDKKINEGVTKYIFRKAMKGIVPGAVLERRDKIGFAAPDKIWLKYPSFVAMIDNIMESKEFKSRPYWKPGQVKRLFKEHLNGKKDNSGTIWRIINAELWLRIFIDQCSSA